MMNTCDDSHEKDEYESDLGRLTSNRLLKKILEQKVSAEAILQAAQSELSRMFPGEEMPPCQQTALDAFEGALDEEKDNTTELVLTLLDTLEHLHGNATGADTEGVAVAYHNLRLCTIAIGATARYKKDEQSLHPLFLNIRIALDRLRLHDAFPHLLEDAFADEQTYIDMVWTLIGLRREQEKEERVSADLSDDAVGSMAKIIRLTLPTALEETPEGA